MSKKHPGLNILKGADWAILEAGNPGGKAAGAAQNDRDLAMLEQLLGNAGLRHHRVQGFYNGIANVAVLVEGISAASAQFLGALFGQESVLVPAGLLYISGLLNPKCGALEVGDYESLGDNYTVLPGGEAFRMPINFDRHLRVLPPAVIHLGEVS
jgi:hypothetical protein